MSFCCLTVWVFLDSFPCFVFVVVVVAVFVVSTPKHFVLYKMRRCAIWKSIVCGCFGINFHVLFLLLSLLLFLLFLSRSILCCTRCVVAQSGRVLCKLVIILSLPLVPATCGAVHAFRWCAANSCIYHHPSIFLKQKLFTDTFDCTFSTRPT